MTTTIRESAKIGYSPLIENDPDLMKVVRKANEFFQDLVEKHHLEDANRELEWISTDEIPPQHIMLSLKEKDSYGTRHVSDWISRNWFFDDVNRGIFIRALVQAILRKRWYQIDTAMNEKIRELEYQESMNAQTDSD